MAVDDLQSKASEMVKKILTAGVGAIFLTEESLRNLVAEFKLPKEFLTGLLDSAAKTKNEFLQNISSEVINRVTSQVDLKDYIEDLLRRHEVELDIKVRFKKKD